MIKKLLSLMLLIPFVCPVAAQTLEDLTFYTEDYPPFNYMENGDLKGISVDILERILTRLNSSHKISDVKVVDWDTAYQALLNGPNTAVLSVSKSDYRAPLFKWAGSVTSASLGIIGKKDGSVKVSSLKDLKKLRIAAIKNDAGEHLARNAGVKESNIVHCSEAQDCVVKLRLNEADVWIYDVTSSAWALSRAGETENFGSLYSLPGQDVMFAFSRDVPDEAVLEFQKTLNQLKKEGDFLKVIKKYQR